MQRRGRDGFHGHGDDADAVSSGDQLTNAIADAGAFGDADSLSDGDRLADAVADAIPDPDH
jgi:hypothetical protein